MRGDDRILPVSVCIATHKRPEGLDLLLTSLVEQEDAPSFEVVVVDNDKGRSAEAVANRFAERLRLTYLVEPVRGLARVRNRAVAASRGTFLAFIDDDEWATPRWLATLDAMAEKSGADVVVGPVTTVFDEGTPLYIRSCVYFDRATVSDGGPVPWHLTHTSNAYVRKSAMPHLTQPFDHAFDLTGGEDSDLFSRMIQRGAIIVGSARAGVFEHRPRSRANLRWVLRRALRNGSNFATLEWGDLTRRRRLLSGLHSGLRGLREGFNALRVWRRSRRRATGHLLSMADGIGRLAGALGFQVKEYRIHP